MNHSRNRNSGERLPLLRPLSALNWSIFSIRSAIWCNGDAIRSDSTVLISGDGSMLVSLFDSPIGCWHRDYDLALGNWTSLSVMGFAMCSYVVFSVRNSLIPLKVMAFLVLLSMFEGAWVQAETLEIRPLAVAVIIFASAFVDRSASFCSLLGGLWSFLSLHYKHEYILFWNDPC